MKKGIALIAALIISVLLLGCEEAATYATADDAKAALDEMGIQPTAAENSSYTYVLTEQQAQELGKTVDALYSVEGDLILVLEVTE